MSQEIINTRRTTMPPLIVGSQHVAETRNTSIQEGQREIVTGATTSTVTSSVSGGVFLHLTSSRYVNVTEEEMLKILLRQVYTTMIQSKCKFLQDSVLYSYNHEQDQNHISQVLILNGLGIDLFSSTKEAREDTWSRLSQHIKQLMQDHRNRLGQRLKNMVIEAFMKLQQEDNDDDSYSQHSEFDFIRDWPDDDPADASLLVETRTSSREEPDRILDVQPHVAHIYKTQETYASFVCKCMKPCVGKDIYRSFENGAKTLEECFTVEDEALCLLVLVNSIRKWQDEAKWRSENAGYQTSSKVPEDIKKTFSKSLYTELQTDSTERRKTTRHGWSHEGQVVFLLFQRAVALKRSSFPHMEEYRTYVSSKLRRKGKRKAWREFFFEEQENMKYKRFIAMSDDMNGCID